MNSQPIDLIFLDIQMPALSGLQFLQSLKSRPMVILITAFKKYALEGFELDVLDYLVKPVSFERFLKAVNKAADNHSIKRPLIQPPAETVLSDYLFVNVEYNLVKIVINDIAYIEGLKDYIRIHLSSSEKPVITKLSLKALVDKLPSAKFIRVHKSYMVAVEKIAFIRKNRIYIGNHIIPVSDFYKESLFSIISPRNLK
jgi:DNA-binding LytR/AlgR family response regulator